MAVVHPREQRARLGWHGTCGTGSLRAVELVGHRAHAFEHAREIGDRLAHVFERGVQPAQQLARLRLVARPVDLDHLPGLERAPRAVGADLAQRAARVAPHGQHRMHDQVHGDVHLAEHDADGIDQERHVGRDHAHQRAMRAPLRRRARAAARCRRAPIALARARRIRGARARPRRDPPGGARAGLLRRRRGRTRAGNRASARVCVRGTLFGACATIFSMSARRAAGILPSIELSQAGQRGARLYMRPYRDHVRVRGAELDGAA